MHAAVFVSEDEPHGIFPRTSSIISGCSSAWLERLLWEQEAEGSNPFTPTKSNLKGGDCFLSDRYCHICSSPIAPLTFPMRGNICFECEVVYNHDIATTDKGRIIMGRKKDWLRTARGSGHYPLSFNFVLAKCERFVLCSYCGGPVPEKELTRDHVYPKSKGGIIKAPACEPCNIAKQDMYPIQWALYALEMELDFWRPELLEYSNTAVA